MRKTYRCNRHKEDLVDGDGTELTALSHEHAAEDFLADGDKISIAADIIGTDFDERHTATVFVVEVGDDGIDRPMIRRVKVRLSASVKYTAMAMKSDAMKPDDDDEIQLAQQVIKTEVLHDALDALETATEVVRIAVSRPGVNRKALQLALETLAAAHREVQQAAKP